MNLGSEVIFTITGMVLVFVILILLQLIIRLEGKLFDKMGGKEQGSEANKAQSAPAPRKAAPAPAKKSAAPASAGGVQVGQGVPGEVVAAIMAAISAMSGGQYTLKAVRRGYNNWGKAGVNDTTEPF